MLTDVNTTPNQPGVPNQPEVQIGHYTFDPQTGHVRPLEIGRAQETRLAPQPAKLLQLLIEKGGDLLSREEIRAELWPETHIEFDQSLRFCVRQIRAALNDSASSPTYIETLPKRGYRLLQPAEAIQSQPATNAKGPQDPGGGPQDGDSPGSRPTDPDLKAKRDTSPHNLGPQTSSTQTSRAQNSGTQNSRALRYWILAAALVVTVATAWIALRGSSTSPVGTPIRLAIMPFELATEGDASSDLAELSEWLLAELTGLSGDQVEVVGPRSTAEYSSFPFPRIKALKSDLSIDYVLNGRYLTDTDEPKFLVELIRLDDGAHPWAQFYRDTDWSDIGESIRDHVVEALALPP